MRVGNWIDVVVAGRRVPVEGTLLPLTAENSIR